MFLVLHVHYHTYVFCCTVSPSDYHTHTHCVKMAESLFGLFFTYDSPTLLQPLTVLKLVTTFNEMRPSVALNAD